MKGLGFSRPIGTIEPSNGRYPNAFSSKETVSRELGYSVFFRKNQHVDDLHNGKEEVFLSGVGDLNSENNDFFYKDIDNLHNGKEEVFVRDLSGLPGAGEKIAVAPISTWTKIKNFLSRIIK